MEGSWLSTTFYILKTLAKYLFYCPSRSRFCILTAFNVLWVAISLNYFLQKASNKFHLFPSSTKNKCLFSFTFHENFLGAYLPCPWHCEHPFFIPMPPLSQVSYSSVSELPNIQCHRKGLILHSSARFYLILTIMFPVFIAWWDFASFAISRYYLHSVSYLQSS